MTFHPLKALLGRHARGSGWRGNEAAATSALLETSFFIVCTVAEQQIESWDKSYGRFFLDNDPASGLLPFWND